MFEIVIEKDVLLPDGRRGVSSKFPFSRMEVGDSFAVSVPEWAHDSGAYAAKVRGSASGWGKQHLARFTVLLVDQKTKVRVWRVE